MAGKRSGPKGGRPTKYNPKVHGKIFLLARRGFTDHEICQLLNVGEKTLNVWKTKHGFLDDLRAVKDEADDLVERSLFERAVGYDHPETKVFCANGEILTHQVTRHEPPDTTACLYWLKNRRPEAWRDRKDEAEAAPVTINVVTYVVPTTNGHAAVHTTLTRPLADA